jgi:ketosteroid isomerase-like protein
MTNSTNAASEGTPAVVAAWLDAHARHDIEAELSLFSPDIVVVDDGNTHQGLAQVRRWLDRASSEYQYTATVLDAGADGTDTVVTARLEGDFPGSTVDLRYRFTVDGQRIAALTIGP